MAIPFVLRAGTVEYMTRLLSCYATRLRNGSAMVVATLLEGIEIVM